MVSENRDFLKALPELPFTVPRRYPFNTVDFLILIFILSVLWLLWQLLSGAIWVILYVVYFAIQWFTEKDDDG